MAKKRHTPSSIDRLEPEFKELVGELKKRGRTITEIRAALVDLLGEDDAPSRSAIGRHVRTLAETQELMQSSRDMAVALADKYGDQTDNKMARLNIELLHSLLMRAQIAYLNAQDGDGATLTVTGQELAFLGRANKSLADATKLTNEEARQIRKEAKEEATREAAENATKAARAKGLSKDTVDAIRFAVLGSDS